MSQETERSAGSKEPLVSESAQEYLTNKRDLGWNAIYQLADDPRAYYAQVYRLLLIHKLLNS